MAGGGPPAPIAPIARLQSAFTAGWDGGPMLLLPARLAASWEGAEPPGDGRVIECDYRHDGPERPATDYDRACAAVVHRAAFVPVGPGAGLITPQPFVAIATCDRLAGFLGILQGEDPLVARWALTEPDQGWQAVGDLVIESGQLHVQSAALRGGDPRGHRLPLDPGRYAVEELAFFDERGELHLLRAISR